MFIASFVFIQIKLDAYYSWMLWNGDDWVRISVKKWLLADSFHCKTNFWIIGTFVKSITFYSLILRWWYTCVDKKCKHKLTHKHAQTCRHLFEYNKHSICCSRLLLSKLVNWQEICARALTRAPFDRRWKCEYRRRYRGGGAFHWTGERGRQGTTSDCFCWPSLMRFETNRNCLSASICFDAKTAGR